MANINQIWVGIWKTTTEYNKVANNNYPNAKVANNNYPNSKVANNNYPNSEEEHEG